jgi:hypothetical protein
VVSTVVFRHLFVVYRIALCNKKGQNFRRRRISFSVGKNGKWKAKRRQYTFFYNFLIDWFNAVSILLSVQYHQSIQYNVRDEGI